MKAARVTTRFRRRGPVALLAALALLLLGVPVGTAGAAGGPVLPSKDPFYRYSGSLAGKAPGTILKRRTVSTPAITEPGVTSRQVLYVTTNQLHRKALAVATILVPAAAAPGTLVSYQTFYDGLGDVCDPSYTLRQSASTSPGDPQFLQQYLMAGHPVVTADYEELNNAFGAGQQSGYATLDAIRAAETLLAQAPSTTKVAEVGYSGGAIASVYAAELAKRYAPELNLVGTAAGGVATNYADILHYISGSATWSGAMPAVMLGVARGYHLDIYRILSAYGAKIVRDVSTKCIDPSHPVTTYQKMLKRPFKDIFKVQRFTRILDHAIMSRIGKPDQPMFLAVGNTDGKGDGVMVSADVAAQARAYCREGVTTTFQQFQGDHYQAAVQFEPAALSYVNGVLGGTPPPDGCATVPATGGNLTPLPLLRTSYAGLRRGGHGVALRVGTDRGRYTHLTYVLRRGGRTVGAVKVATVGATSRSVVVPSTARLGRGSLMQVQVKHGPTLMATQSYRVR